MFTKLAWLPVTGILLFSGCGPTRHSGAVKAKTDPVLASQLEQSENRFDLVQFSWMIGAQLSTAETTSDSARSTLAQWADEVSAAIKQTDDDVDKITALLGFLHNVRGIRVENDTPADCALQTLLDSKKGAPIVLAVVIRELAEQCDIPLAIVEVPGGEYSLKTENGSGYVELKPGFPAATEQAYANRVIESKEWNLTENAARRGLFFRALTKRETAARLLCEAGQSLLRAQKPVDALDLLTLAVAKPGGDYPMGRLALGRAKFAVGDVAGADTEYSQAIAQYPDWALACYERGIARQTVDFDDAADDFNRCVTLKPGFARAYAALADIHCRLGRYNHSMDYGKKAVQADPESTCGYRALGELYAKVGRHEEAAQNLHLSIQKGDNDPDTVLLLGSVYRQNNLPEKALDTLNEGISRCSSPPRLIHARAGFFASVGKWKEAVSDLKTLLERTPEPGHLYHEIGDAYVQMNALGEAAGYYAEGSRRYPDDYAYPYKEARAAALLGKLDEAADHLHAAYLKGFRDRELTRQDPAFEKLLAEKSLDLIFQDNRPK